MALWVVPAEFKISDFICSEVGDGVVCSFPIRGCLSKGNFKTTTTKKKWLFIVILKTHRVVPQHQWKADSRIPYTNTSVSGVPYTKLSADLSSPQILSTTSRFAVPGTNRY